MVFRPLPVLTLVFLPALALLIGLGVWQTERARWKADLLSAYEAQEALPPAPLGEALCTADPAGAVRLDLSLTGEEIRVWGAGPAGEPGWLILRTAQAPACASAPLLLVETGFEPLNGVRSPAPETLTLEPWPEIGPFTPENRPDSPDLFRFEAQRLAQAAGAAPEDLLPVWARWEARSAAERVRIGPADHVGYALTWFGLAGALLAVYLMLHHRQGRLLLRKRR